MTPAQLEAMRPLYKQAVRLVELGLLDLFMQGDMDADLFRKCVAEARSAPMEEILEQSQRDLEQEGNADVQRP